jgi:hypothetical protein
MSWGRPAETAWGSRGRVWGIGREIRSGRFTSLIPIIYTCVHIIYMFPYIYICIYIYISMYINPLLQIHLFDSYYIYMCIYYTCIYMHIHLCIYIYIYIYINLSICPVIFIKKKIISLYHIYIYLYINLSICIKKYRYIYLYTYIHTFYQNPQIHFYHQPICI